MIADLLQNKFLLFGAGLLVIVITYRLFFAKDKSKELVEREYKEIINSDKYKVKGQY